MFGDSDPNYRVVSIGRLTAFYVVLVPMEFIPSKPPLYAYVSICIQNTN